MIQPASWSTTGIQVAVDTDPRPGRFLPTGSAQVLALRDVPDALPGRMEIVELWSFSQGEIDRSPDTRRPWLWRADHHELGVRHGRRHRATRTNPLQRNRIHHDSFRTK